MSKVLLIVRCALLEQQVLNEHTRRYDLRKRVGGGNYDGKRDWSMGMNKYRILKLVRCYVNNHVWIFSGDSSNGEPPPEMECDCGEYTWAYFKYELQAEGGDEIADSLDLDES